MGFLFYAGLSAGMQAYGGFSTAALSAMYDEPLTTIGIVLGLYLFASPIGVLCGGWIADKIDAHDRFAAAGLEPSEIERGGIHSSFQVLDPSGTSVTITSSHAVGAGLR